MDSQRTRWRRAVIRENSIPQIEEPAPFDPLGSGKGGYRSSVEVDEMGSGMYLGGL